MFVANLAQLEGSKKKKRAKRIKEKTNWTFSKDDVRKGEGQSGHLGNGLREREREKICQKCDEWMDIGN